MRMDIKNLLFKYKLKQWRKQSPHQAIYHSYRTAKRILLLFESDLLERNIQVKALVKQLHQDGKEVTAWGYVAGKKVAQSAILRDYRVLAQQDFSRWGWPIETHINDIRQEHYDLIIDLNVSGLLPLRYLSLYADADFRCGLRTTLQPMPDLMIDLSETTAPEAAPQQAENITAAEVVEAAINPAYLFDQIIHYLQTIEEKA